MPKAVICGGLLFAKMDGRTKLHSDPITSSYAGGILGVFLSDWTSYLLSNIMIGRVLIDMVSIPAAAENTWAT